MVVVILPIINIGYNPDPIKVNEKFASDFSGPKESVLKLGDLLLFVSVLPCCCYYISIQHVSSLRSIKFSKKNSLGLILII